MESEISNTGEHHSWPAKAPHTLRLSHQQSGTASQIQLSQGSLAPWVHALKANKPVSAGTDRNLSIQNEKKIKTILQFDGKASSSSEMSGSVLTLTLHFASITWFTFISNSTQKGSSVFKVLFNTFHGRSSPATHLWAARPPPTPGSMSDTHLPALRRACTATLKTETERSGYTHSVSTMQLKIQQQQ